MTDFIHETPPTEPSKPTEPEKPVSEKERQKRVYTYIAVLFTAAFLLILWSFLANHRSNQEVINELRGSTDLMQSTLEQNAELESEVRTLESEIEELQQTLADAQENAQAEAQANAELHNALNAMDWLIEIEQAYRAKNFTQARESIRAFEANELSQYLPAAPLHTDASGDDAPSPAERYQEIVTALFPNGIS